MEDIIPSNEKLKQEAIMDDLPLEVREKIQRIKQLKEEIKIMEKQIKPYMDHIAEVMDDMDVEELNIGDYTVVRVKGFAYTRMKSLTNIKKIDPNFEENNPDMVQEVNVKPYVKVTTNE